MVINPITGLDEITIEQAIKLSKCKLPDKLRKQLLGEDVEYTPVELTHELPIYYAKVIALMYPTLEPDLAWIHAAEREHLFMSYCLPWLIKILHPTFDGLEKLDCFNHDGVTYYLPTFEKIVGVEVPQVTAIEFQESADIDLNSRMLATGNYDYLPQFIAIYCRPSGEKYDQKTMLKRAELFKSLPFDIAVMVFFSLTVYAATLAGTILTRLQKKALEAVQELTQDGEES